MSFIKEKHVRTMDSKKLKISHIFYCLRHIPISVVSVVFTMNNFAELQLLPMMEFSLILCQANF